jgi:hypothetical protein
MAWKRARRERMFRKESYWPAKLVSLRSSAFDEERTETDPDPILTYAVRMAVRRSRAIGASRRALRRFARRGRFSRTD